MKKFSDMGIDVKLESFTGDKIKIEKVLNREIVVLAHKIEDSKFDGDRLTLQIQIAGEKRVIFTGSKMLIEMIKAVKKTDFPFKTTIVKSDERFHFT